MRDFFDRTARFYDADYASIGYDKDIAFYVDLAREIGGPVFEMGCGTGRVLLPIARAGTEIHGIDLSPGMLRVLEQKLAAEPHDVRARVTFAEGDMRTVHAGRLFNLVTAPFRVVQALLTREDQRAWLRNAKRHLLPGGRLCFDIFQPNFSKLANPPEDAVDVDRIDPATGVHSRRYHTVHPRSELQLIDLAFHFVEEDASGKVLSDLRGAFTIRWFTRGELENLLELEGFKILEYWGDFRRTPFGEGATDQVILARLAQPVT